MNTGLGRRLGGFPDSGDCLPEKQSTTPGQPEKRSRLSILAGTAGSGTVALGRVPPALTGKHDQRRR